MLNQYFDDQGNLRPLTRVEFSPIGSGLFQWQLWSDTTLLEQHVSRDLDQFLEATRFICEDADERLGKEECELPPGLDCGH